MVRQILSITVTVCLCLAGLQAPFEHVHPKDPHHRHAKGVGHFHVSPAKTVAQKNEGPALARKSHEHTAVWKSWLSATLSRVTVDQGILPDGQVMPIPVVVSAARIRLLIEFHDPPDIVDTSPRAPPSKTTTALS